MFRQPLSEFFRRITKLDVAYGQASGGLTAERIESIDENVPVVSKPDIRAVPEKDKSEERQIEEQDDKDWFFRMHKAFREKDFEAATHIFEEHKKQETNVVDRIRDESIYLHFRYSFAGDLSALPQLRRLIEASDTDEQKEDPLFWLSNCYKQSKNYLEAINLWKSAVDQATDESRKTEFIRSLAYAYRDNNEPDKAYTLLEKRLKEKRPNNEKKSLFEAISEIEKVRSNELGVALALERVVELDSDDKDSLFNAAYAQGNADLPLLAINNYDTLIKLDPEQSMALNNMGVAADNMELATKAAQFFRRACQKGNTLAMSNQAYRYLKEGFVDEAEQLMTDALKNDSPDQSVPTALSKINEKKEKEEKKWKSALTKAFEFRKFMRAYASAYFDEHAVIGDFSGAWITADGVSVNFEVKDERLKAEWESEIGLLVKSKYHCSLTGNVRNSSVDLIYKRAPSAEARGATILAGSNKISCPCYGYISENNKRMYIQSKDPDEKIMIEFKKA